MLPSIPEIESDKLAAETAATDRQSIPTSSRPSMLVILTPSIPARIEVDCLTVEILNSLFVLHAYISLSKQLIVLKPSILALEYNRLTAGTLSRPAMIFNISVSKHAHYTHTFRPHHPRQSLDRRNASSWFTTIFNISASGSLIVLIPFISSIGSNPLTTEILAPVHNAVSTSA